MLASSVYHTTNVVSVVSRLNIFKHKSLRKSHPTFLNPFMFLLLFYDTQATNKSIIIEIGVLRIRRQPSAKADKHGMLYIIFNVLTTVTTWIFSFFLANQLSCNTKNIVLFTKPWFCVIVIVFTPAIHALEQSYRVFSYPGPASTLLEGLKELFTSLTTFCFMTLLDLQLQQVYGKDFSDLEKKEFQIHWPFDLLRPFIYVSTEDKINLMRFLCYLPSPATIIMFGIRAYLEQSRGFSEFYGFMFQVIHFTISSLGDMAVYSFSQGVEAHIAFSKSSKMSNRIAIFKLSMGVLWLQGPGLEILHAVQDFVIGIILVCWAVRQMWAFSGFSLSG